MFPVDTISLLSLKLRKVQGLLCPSRYFMDINTKMFPPLSDGFTRFCTSSLLSEVLKHELLTMLLKIVEYVESL